MLYDDFRLRAQEGSRAQKTEDLGVFVDGCVGRIDENEIVAWFAGSVLRGKFFQAAEGVDGKNGGSAVNAEGFEVAAYQRCCWGVIFDEDDFRCAAAQGFDAHGAGASEDIDEAGTVHRVAQNIEQSLTQTIGGGAKGLAFQTFQDTAAVGAGD